MVFFFQAEDGIRDVAVTGVQTCALPISLDEIKAEAIKRAETGMYPLIGLAPFDVKQAFASIRTPDYDEWAAAFIAVGDRYMAEAKSLEARDPAKANADYLRAWRIYSFGRWPVPSSP